MAKKRGVGRELSWQESQRRSRKRRRSKKEKLGRSAGGREDGQRVPESARRGGRGGEGIEQRDSCRIPMAKWLSYLNGGGAASRWYGALTLPKRKLTPPPPTCRALLAKTVCDIQAGERGARQKSMDIMSRLWCLVPRYDPPYRTGWRKGWETGASGWGLFVTVKSLNFLRCRVEWRIDAFFPPCRDGDACPSGKVVVDNSRPSCSVSGNCCRNGSR